jgi:Domain of unknown function (DUF4440)
VPRLDDPSLAEGELLELERRRCEALGADDLATLRALTSRDYLHVHANGRVEDYDAYFDRLAGNAYRRTDRGDLRIRLHGPVAVVTGTLVTTVRRSELAPLLRITGFATQVWSQEDGAWRHLSFQVTSTEPTVEVEG